MKDRRPGRGGGKTGPAKVPAKSNVRSIAAELEKKQLANLRKAAEKTGNREAIGRVSMLETMYELADLDMDQALAELRASDHPEAAEAAAGLRSANAVLSCTIGHVEEGFAEWEAVMREHPTSAAPYVMRGRWRLENEKDARQALADFDRAVALAPARSSGYRWRAQCLDALGDGERALANYRRAVALDPDDVDTLNALARALDEQGALDEALVAWKRLVALEPKRLSFWWGLSRMEAEAESGTQEGLLAACNGAIACTPDMGRLYWDRTRIREELVEIPVDYLDQNLRDYDLALANGCRLADVFVNKADILAQRGELAAAVATLDEGAAEHPDDGWIFTWRAEFKRRLGDAEGARADDAIAKAHGSWSLEEARQNAPP